MKKNLSYAALVAAAVLAAAAGMTRESPAQAASGTREKGLFSEREYRAHLKFLAHDLCEGRAPGTRGGDLAAHYIATRFEAASLAPISRKAGYFQSVPMQGNLTDSKTVRMALIAGDKRVEVASLKEAVLGSEVPEKRIRLQDELLFVGYGIEAPELGWNDYKDADVHGKVLVMLVNDPDFEKTGFGGKGLTYYGRWTYKQEIARIKGARGLLLIHTDASATYGFPVVQSSWAVERVSLEGEIRNPLAVSGWISRPAMDRALALVGLDYEALKLKAEDKNFVPFPLGLKVDVALDQTFREFSSPNVIGILPGTTLADEAVLFMAHYDHLGVGPEIGGDRIYNGAVDNASGTAALLCLARAFASAKEAPERTVIFLATTAEEKGLLGSEYYAAHPVVPLSKTVIALNKDCCNFYGRRDGFVAYPVRFTDAGDVFKKLGEDLGLKLHLSGVDRGGGVFRMDSFPLCARGVVGLSIGLRGKYLTMDPGEVKRLRAKVGRWYHQPTDEIRPFWRYDGILQELALLHHIGRHYADGAPRPKPGAADPYGAAVRVRDRKYTRRRKL